MSKFRISGAKYFIFQEELSDTGRLHFQGAVIFKNALRLSGVRAAIPGAHWEIMEGSPEEAFHYCKKPIAGCDCKHCKHASENHLYVRGPWEHGEKPVGAGKRTDLESLKRKLDEGAQEKEIAEEMFGTWSRTYKAIREYKLLTASNRTTQTKAIALWGPPSGGKSTRALELAGDDGFWLSKPADRGTVWWDGFTPGGTIVVDEFYGWMARDTCQRMVDRFPWQVQTKGGTIRFNSPLVVFTSNQHPREWWRIGLGAMERRLAEPIGRIEYISTDEYPDPESWITSDKYHYHGTDVL